MVQRLRQHPLTRALRPDKLTLAGLEATLRLYLDEPQALAAIPTLRMLDPAGGGAGPPGPGPGPQRAPRLGGQPPGRVVDSVGRAGGGALPQVPLPSRALALAVPP